MIRRDGARLILAGAVTLATHVELRDAAAALLGDDDIVVDWSAVDAVDSSALCLILSWRRHATAAGRQVEQQHLPVGLTALAELYGVKELLGA